MVGRCVIESIEKIITLTLELKGVANNIINQQIFIHGRY